jgi:hypothetical protein
MFNPKYNINDLLRRDVSIIYTTRFIIHALKCTLYPNICNKTPENYSQIYAVRKLVPKCAYLSQTEIRLTRVTIVSNTLFNPSHIKYVKEYNGLKQKYAGIGDEPMRVEISY